MNFIWAKHLQELPPKVDSVVDFMNTIAYNKKHIVLILTVRP